MNAPLFGFPPHRMKVKMAAYYCGMSDSAFLRAVEQGSMPKGRNTDGGTYWLRTDLENAIEKAMMLEASKPKGFGQRI